MSDPKNSKNNSSQKKIKNPHDRFFRGAMSDPEVALAFIRRYLPHLVEEMDPDSLHLMQASFIDEELREHIN